jgi:D-glycero-D-manno-heptose 1,7-bisphosphate phosphatase
MKAFFLDRDGVLNVDTNFVHTPEEWTWCDGAVDALRWISGNGFRIIVVTNQSGISRGRYTQEQARELHLWVDQQLEPEDIRIDQWLMAPHHPDFDPPPHQYPPEDRKPGTGMFLKAIQKHGINPKQSYMAGDKITDLKPALTLNIQPFFIRSRHEPNQDKTWLRRNGIGTFDRLYDAVGSLR